MSDKYEWRKKEKSLYIPKNKPELLEVPPSNFITLSGEGSPEDAVFTEYIGTLYSLAYTIKMHPKTMTTKPSGYFDFTVYPLEGIWDINDRAKADFLGTIDKKDLVYQLMIRQPKFVDTALYEEMLHLVKSKRDNPLLEQVKFTTIAEGRCIQMLHLGPFENESHTFEEMESFAQAQGLTRRSKVHREIYLSDPRKVAPEKLKTVLRFQVI
ncbi:GyrI-like domain-containing protein [Shewanella nanhaiensis]|uniref:GyrI-like domain-containing protein n=1 Tax=Shewanella nanhaiensis TaxID=2864872 RepID=A0ABS7DXB8_9GAMM|nr:GyrI-like domain-containing protein [Shewanella nanhaiensis]MBW8182070.1 GyrI-like domain-containing protein [Shewanella nanhaiensis]